MNKEEQKSDLLFRAATASLNTYINALLNNGNTVDYDEFLSLKDEFIQLDLTDQFEDMHAQILTGINDRTQEASVQNQL